MSAERRFRSSSLPLTESARPSAYPERSSTGSPDWTWMVSGLVLVRCSRRLRASSSAATGAFVSPRLSSTTAIPADRLAFLALGAILW